MQKVLTAEEMREVDRLTTEKYGIPSILLMENAAHAAARVITEKLDGSVKGKSFLILCGKGNNGGDGAALARILWNQGANVEVYLFGKIEDTKGNARVNFEILEKLPVFFEEVRLNDEWVHTTGFEVEKFAVVIDALWGTGLTRPIELQFEKTIQASSNRRYVKNIFRISIDVPSGLNSDLESLIGENFEADLSITFTAPKLANVFPPASNFNGELVVANIGSPQLLIDNSPSKLFLAEKQDAEDWLFLTKFTPDSYKNKRGHALLIVGSQEYTGAAVLAGNAAMVSGVGLTTIATSKSAQPAVSAKVLEEIITHGLTETKKGAISKRGFEEFEKLAEKVDVIGIGCGLNSAEKTTKDFVREVIENCQMPIVIDADGLNALSPFDINGSDDLPIILTPHEGEFLRLLGTTDKEVLKDRVKAVRDFAQKHHVILVLKGERTLIAAPDGRVVINPTGNSGLGKAGNGDTLTGIITGFIAQTMQTEHLKISFKFDVAKVISEVFDAVVAAVYIAGLAGDIAEKKYGKRSMLASDVRECLAEAFRELEKEN